MALQSSGTITIQDIADEFGGIAPHSLSEYYRDGIYVGSNNTGVPTSGTISLSDFYGTSAALVVTVTEGSFTHNGENYGYGATAVHYSSPSNSPSYGSRSPTAFNGANIKGLRVTDFKGAYNFYVILAGNRAQSFFTSVDVQGFGVLTSAAASHVYNSALNQTQWSWSVGSLGGWDGAGTRTVAIV